MKTIYHEGQEISGGYILKKFAGRGGFGEVWQARDETLKRDVALKFLLKLPDAGESSKFISDEGSILCRLSASGKGGEHILNVNSASPPQGDIHAFLDLEWMNGGSLSDLLRSGQPLNEREIVNMAIQIARALKCAHSERIIHYDIKPSNILLKKDEGMKVVYKLSDFGLAKKFGKLTGTTWGTPAYMSPEQFNPKEKSGFKTDIYSFGVLLFQCATGRLPYLVTSRDPELRREEYKKQHRDEPIPPVENQGISSSLKELIERCLVKWADDRSDIDEVLIRLTEGKAEVPAFTPPQTGHLTADTKISGPKWIVHRETGLEFRPGLSDGSYLPARMINKGDYQKFISEDFYRKWQPLAIPISEHDGGYLEHWISGRPDNPQSPLSGIPFRAAAEFAGWLGGRLPYFDDMKKIFSGGESPETEELFSDYLSRANLPLLQFWCNDNIEGSGRRMWCLLPDSPLGDQLTEVIRPERYCFPHYIFFMILPRKKVVETLGRKIGSYPDPSIFSSSVSGSSGGRSG